MSRRAAAAAALLAAALLGGCASLLPPQTRALQAQPRAVTPAPVELARVPFFPQAEFECGPAALATVLGAAGIAVAPEALTAQVYLPARRGSLQIEMLATARRQGALAVRLPPSLEALLREVSAGHPVLVLQNLGLSFAPLWHYAVVVGHDVASGRVLLRSGLTEREVMRLSTFEHTWARSGHWAFVALPPGRLPAAASRDEVVAAAVAFERVAAPALAQRSYDAALARWPDDLTLAVGAGNSRAAGGDLAGAAQVFEAAALRHDSAAAWVNLARLRLQQSQHPAAEAAARRALAASAAEPVWRDSARQTLAQVLVQAGRQSSSVTSTPPSAR